jgi:hypothetical protein
MRNYFRFLAIGLVLGLYTEVLLKLVAGIKPAAFIVALFIYPVIVTLSFAASRIIDRSITALWKADLMHYLATGVGGLAFEWILLGNGPGSNAFQLGMFAMWTTFCFGPRVLTRDSVSPKTRHWFWRVFGAVGTLLALFVFLAPSREARVVLAVLSLSGAYIVWSIWLLVLAWLSRQLVTAELVTEVPSGE